MQGAGDKCTVLIGVISQLFWMFKESAGSQNVSGLGFIKTTDNYRDREGAGRMPLRYIACDFYHQMIHSSNA
jgi:hypothetical protein